MKAAPLASHLLCLAAGVLLATTWLRPASNKFSSAIEDEAAAAVHAPPAKTAARAARAATHPRELLEASARMPMESGHRQALKRQLFAEWGERDPQGLLAWLKDRPWDMTGRNVFHDGMEGALKSLARKDPEGLLRYARQEGSSAALRAWLKSGLPAEILRRVTAGEAGSFPEWVIDEIFEQGCKIDPHFHEQLRSVAGGAGRAEAAVTIASSFLDSRRFGEFLEWIGRDGDILPMKEVGERLGRELADPAFDPGLFDKLPEAAKAGAADGFFQALNGNEDPFSSDSRINVEPEQLLKLLSLLQDQGLLEQRGELAGEAIEDNFQPIENPQSNLFGGSEVDPPAPEEIAETNRSRAMGLIEWAEALPAGAESTTLRIAAWKSALTVDPAAQSEIDRIPDPKLRDFCWAWAVHLLEGEAAEGPLEKIVDPEVRAQLERYREWKKDAAANDPFGSYDGPLPWDE